MNHVSLDIFGWKYRFGKSVVSYFLISGKATPFFNIYEWDYLLTFLTTFWQKYQQWKFQPDRHKNVVKIAVSEYESPQASVIVLNDPQWSEKTNNGCIDRVKLSLAKTILSPRGLSKLGVLT